MFHDLPLLRFEASCGCLVGISYDDILIPFSKSDIFLLQGLTLSPDMALIVPFIYVLRRTGRVLTPVASPFDADITCGWC
jgi:hypothetical protein